MDLTAWIPLLERLGALGILAVVVWRISPSLDRVSRVLYRIEGILIDRERTGQDTPPPRRRGETG